MESYLIYIGKVSISAGTFYIVFLILFQNQKHFVFNRFYLPISLVLSFIIPLITFTTVKYVEPVLTADYNGFAYLADSSENIIPTGFVFEWYHYLFGLYILGAAGFLFYLLLGHLKAMSIVRFSRIKRLFETEVNITLKDVHPFSFFNKIVLSENTLASPNLKMIVNHENIHVKEKHTLDILFVEILFLLQWFNPFAWLLKDAVKNNLEYKTDNQIIEANNPKDYQLAMVGLAHKKGVAPFLTALNGSQLKNRIIMMKKETGNKYALLKQLIVLPLLAILVMGLANREIITEIIETDKQVEISQLDNEVTKKSKEFTTTILDATTNKQKIKGKVTNQNGDPISGASILIKGKQIGTITDSQGNYEIRLDEENETLIFKMDGFEKQEIKIDNKTEINIKLKADKSANVDKTRTTVADYHVKASSTITGETPLYIVDGKEIADPNTIQPDDIESISVLKNESSVAAYGERGKNGVILIYTKGAKSGLQNQVLIVEDMPEYPGGELALRNFIDKNTKYPETALEKGIQGKVYVTFIINTKGKVTDAKISRGVDPSLNREALRVVNSLPLWKPGKQRGEFVDVPYTVPVNFKPTAQQTQKHNKLGLDGKPLEKGAVDTGNEVKPKITYLPNKNSSSSARLSSSWSNDSILYIVDEKEIDGKSLSEIQPETIESISIIKDSSAVDIYGDKAKNGVIIIALKDTEKKPDVTEITTQLELRKFIAKEIKYPVLAHKANIEKVVKLSVQIDKNGSITSISETDGYIKIRVDEVVITGNKTKEVVVTGYGTKVEAENARKFEEQLLVYETKRVIKKIPVIDISEFKGKTVGITVRFIIRD